MTEHRCAAPAPPLETVIGLRRGRRARTVKLAVTLRSDRATPDAVRRVVEAFTRFVDLVHDEGTPLRRDVPGRQSGSEGGLVTESWEATFPKMAPEDFAILERMVRCSVPGGARFHLVEQAPEHTLLVRTLEREEEATLPDVPWEIAFPAAGEHGVRLTFAEPVMGNVAALIGSAFHIWGDVLGLGGFPGSEGRAGSTGRVICVESTGTLVLRARLEEVACGHAAWEALFEVLSRVQGTAALRRVEIEQPRDRVPRA